MREYRELTKEDLHTPFFRAFSQTWLWQNFLGTMLPDDVGKRVYLVNGILQVENNEQRDKRLKKV